MPISDQHEEEEEEADQESKGGRREERRGRRGDGSVVVHLRDKCAILVLNLSLLMNSVFVLGVLNKVCSV